MKKKIYFRADAGRNIGYGHFIRTLALADMLKDDFDCVFFTQAPTDYQKKEMGSVCRYVELPADESRFVKFLEYLTGDEIVVLDNYFYTTDYQRRIKAKGCKLVCIDDLHDKRYIADVVVNHGPARPDEYDCEVYTRLCLGSDWVLLRKPFLVPIKNNNRNSQIVVCIGGADPKHLTDRLVKMLLGIKIEQKIVVILGDSAYLSEENREKVKIMHNLSAQQMADLFESSLFGIMPASSVRLEATSRGLKVIAGYFVDNQQISYERVLKQTKSFIPVYNFEKLTQEKLADAIKDLYSFNFSVPDYSNVPTNYIKLMLSL